MKQLDKKTIKMSRVDLQFGVGEDKSCLPMWLPSGVESNLIRRKNYDSRTFVLGHY